MPIVCGCEHDLTLHVNPNGDVHTACGAPFCDCDRPHDLTAGEPAPPGPEPRFFRTWTNVTVAAADVFRPAEDD